MSTQEDKLLEIADAIRAKEGTTDPIPANTFKDRIAAIETGVDTSDATATATDLINGETAYVDGVKVTGVLQSIAFSGGSNTTKFTSVETISASCSGRYVYFTFPSNLRFYGNSAANACFSVNIILDYSSSSSTSSSMALCVQCLPEGSYVTSSTIGTTGTIMYYNDCTVDIATTTTSATMTIFFEAFSSSVSFEAVEVAYGSFFGYYT